MAPARDVGHLLGPGGCVAAFLPTIVSVDVEPDRRPAGRSDRTPWEGWARSYEVFRDVRARFEEATGAPVRWSWFFRTDPQIETVWGSSGWPIETHRDRVDDLVAHGDEIGVHCHPFRWDGSHWFSDYRDLGAVARCVDASLAAFERATGRRCRSFRFGARWLDDATVRLLAERGVEFDLTVEPGFSVPPQAPDEPFVGRFPDYTHAPRSVYRPGDDFLSPARGPSPGPWMIPLSTGTPERRWRAIRRRLGGALRPSRRRPRPWAPLCFAESPRVFGRVLHNLLATRSTSHLSIVMRSDAAVGSTRTILDANLLLLEDRARRHGLRVVRPDEAVRALEGSVDLERPPRGGNEAKFAGSSSTAASAREC
jgi:hypothetical protein